MFNSKSLVVNKKMLDKLVVVAAKVIKIFTSQQYLLEITLQFLIF